MFLRRVAFGKFFFVSFQAILPVAVRNFTSNENFLVYSYKFKWIMA